MGHMTLTTNILGVICLQAKFDDSSFSHSRDIIGGVKI